MCLVFLCSSLPLLFVYVTVLIFPTFVTPFSFFSLCFAFYFLLCASFTVSSSQKENAVNCKASYLLPSTGVYEFQSSVRCEGRFSFKSQTQNLMVFLMKPSFISFFIIMCKTHHVLVSMYSCRTSWCCRCYDRLLFHFFFFSD